MNRNWTVGLFSRSLVREYKATHMPKDLHGVLSLLLEVNFCFKFNIQIILSIYQAINRKCCF